MRSNKEQSGAAALWFYGFFISGTVGRTAYFCYAWNVVEEPPIELEHALFSYLPTFLYFSGFWIVLSNWIRIYHEHPNSRSHQSAATALLDDARHSHTVKVINVVVRVLTVLIIGTYFLCAVAAIITYAIFGSSYRRHTDILNTIQAVLQSVCALQSGTSRTRHFFS